MGLDTSHDCWHGSYSYFNLWRREVARAAGLPPLQLMSGFCDPDEYPRELKASLPISWDCLKPSALHLLLNHSDCDGELRWQDCNEIAREIERVLPKMACDAQEAAKRWITGLRKAARAKENVDFH